MTYLLLLQVYKSPKYPGCIDQFLSSRGWRGYCLFYGRIVIEAITLQKHAIELKKVKVIYLIALTFPRPPHAFAWCSTYLAYELSHTYNVPCSLYLVYIRISNVLGKPLTLQVVFSIPVAMSMIVPFSSIPIHQEIKDNLGRQFKH